MSADLPFRLVGMAVGAFLGWQLGIITGIPSSPEFLRYVLGMFFAGAAIGLIVTPYITIRPVRWARHGLKMIPALDLLAGVIGMVIGLVFSALLALPLSLLPSPFGMILPFAACLVLAYLGASTVVMRQKDIFEIIGPSWGGLSLQSGTGNGRGIKRGEYVLLDTSAVIDGRIADISQTGFIGGTMLLPRFVLDELQHIADSPDSLRRNRGRRGLDMLNKLQKESLVPIQISEVDIEGIAEVDSKLVKLARQLRAPIVTTDFNLNRVAALQGVQVMNINELANAVKSVVLPGEEMSVRVIQEGKEAGQGVGYLDDGTMVVVESGRRFMGSEIEVMVTRVLQTVAGRMIFAHPKMGDQYQ
jgi:uncharacterized protein YacL